MEGTPWLVAYRSHHPWPAVGRPPAGQIADAGLKAGGIPADRPCSGRLTARPRRNTNVKRCTWVTEEPSSYGAYRAPGLALSAPASSWLRSWACFSSFFDAAGRPLSALEPPAERTSKGATRRGHRSRTR